MSKTMLKKAWMVVLSVITFICVALGCLTLVGDKTASAENAPLFQMQDGASVCLTKDGIRWKVMMDETVATSIKEGNDEFFFILGPTSNFKKVTDGNYAKLLVEGKNYARKIAIDKETIYTDDNITWFANGCVYDVLPENRNLEFTAVACIKDAENGTYTYADMVVDDVSRQMTTVLSRAILDTEKDYYAGISKQYAWFGTEDYPLIVDADKISEWLSMKESNATIADWSYTVSFNYAVDKEAAVTYTSNGVSLSSYNIVVSDTTTAEALQTPAYYAATIFNSVTGANLPITTTAGEYNIYIGADVSEALIGNNWTMDEDDYGIYTKGTDIYFVGETRGTIYAVYRFLEEMGYRFLTSSITKAGSNVFIPKEMAITDVEDISYREISAESVLYNTKAGFAVSQGLNGSFSRDILFTKKYGGANGYMRTYINDNNENVRDGLAHTINHWLDSGLLTYNNGEYAEIFMVDANGQRSADQICYTNSKALSYITEKVLLSIRKNQELGALTDLISVSQKDNNSYCHCDNCQTAEAQYGSFGVVLNFVNQVADEVKKLYPNVMVDTMVYAHYQEVKGNIRARDNVTIRYVGNFGRADSNQGAEGTGAYPNGNGDPTQFNKQVADVAKLAKICENITVWVHAKDATDLFGLYGDIYSAWQIVNALNKYNVKGYYVESEFWSTSAEFGELRSYLWAQLLKNPSMTLDEYKAHMSDFLNGYYGAAATYMQQYIDYLCDRAIYYSNNWGYGGNCFNLNGQYTSAPYGLPLDLLNTLNTYFANAESVVSGDELARVQRSRLHLRYTELNYLYYNDRAAFRNKAEALYDDLDAAGVRMYNEVTLKAKRSINFTTSIPFLGYEETTLKNWWTAGQGSDTVNYTIHFETNGGDAMDDVTISADTSLINFDTTYEPNKDNAIFEGWYLTSTFEEGSRIGTDISLLPENGENTQLTVYAKWDDCTAKARYYWYAGENIGTYFGGQAAKILLDGGEAGDKVTLTMKVKTSQDGTEGASVRLYHSYNDKEWLDKTDEGGYWGGVSLNPATESGWREITMTVTLQQDGYVWLGVANENPGTGQCWVYMKDVTYEVLDLGDYQFTYSGSWFNSETATIITGQAPNANLSITMQVKTSIDGTTTTNPYIGAYATVAGTTDGNFTRGGTLDVSAIGWREITIQVTANENGDVYLGLGRYAEGSAFTVYIKDVSYEVIVNYTIHFETNGGAAIDDVVLTGDTSLVDFDTTYATTKTNAFFEGWYLTETFEAGTRVGTDITSLPEDSTELTVYAKWDNYTAQAQYYSNQGAWFGGQAAKVLVNGKAGDEVILTMKVKTSHDGTSGASIKLYQTYADTEWIGNVEDGYWSGVSLNPATESGWREITMTVTLKQDGYVWLSVANENPGLGQCWVYIKDVSYEVIVNYTIHFEANGGSAIDDVVLTGDTSLVGFDTTYATTKTNAFFEGWYLTSTFEAGTRVGTDITSLPTDGDTELTVYAKWDEYTAKAQYYSNQGAWFGGQAAKILVDGKTGEEVVLTMKVKTSHDGVSGASIKLYQTYADTEWIGNVEDGYWSGVSLNPATESGWREITMTVTLKQDGYVWLSVANENPGLGQCWVYMKDVSYKVIVKYTIHFETNGGEAIGDVVLTEGASLVGFDTAYATTKTNAFFEGWYLTSTFEAGTRVGTDITSLPTDSTDLTVYAKWDEYTAKAQYYSNIGAWFGGQAAKVLVDGKVGDEVVLTMKVKTSHDGISGASIRLYQTYADTEWIGNVEDGYWSGASLNPATESGWREITMTVTLKQDGYVWLSVANENPGLGQCWVYMKDVSYEILDLGDYQFTYSGNWFASETATILAGQTPNANLSITMQVKTSIDGTITTNPYIGSYASTSTSDSNFTNGGTLDISQTGWREITIQVKANENGDVYLGLGRYAEGAAFTVYIKEVSAFEVGDYQFTYSGSWFSSGVSKVASGQEANKAIYLTMKVKTSIDGTITTNPYIGSYTSESTSDSNFTSGGTLDVSATGWREITIQVKANENGDVYLGLGRYAEGSAFTVYIKDVVVEEYEYQFTYSGNWFSSGTAMIMTGQTPNAEFSIMMQVKTSIDGTTTTNPYIGSYTSTSTSDSNFTNGGTLDVAATGWREITIKVKSNENGDVYLGLGRYAEGSAFTVYIKDVSVFYQAQYYWYTGENIGTYFGGQAVKILLDGCKTGDTVTLTMKVKTSQDGTEGASARLYHSYNDKEWLDKTDEGDYWGGVSLNPATESGWREITMTVTLKQDGYVWLGVANENPGLGQCFVYIKDIAVNA